VLATVWAGGLVKMELMLDLLPSITVMVCG